MGNYVIPKMPGESALVWNGTNYWPVTAWTIGPGITTGSGDSWIAGATRYLVGEDSNVGSVHVIAQYSGYTRTGNIDTSNGYFLIRRIASSITTYTGTQSNPGDVWTTQNANQRQGYVYNIVKSGNFLWYNTPYFVNDLGTQTEGTTVTAPTFYIGTSEVVGGVYQQTSVSLSYTIPKAPSAPTSITNTRNSDSKNTVSWVLPATTYTRMRLQRIVDGGTVGAEWTFAADSGVTSYVDTGTAAAHAYSYKLRLELVPEAGEAYTLSSSWKTSSTTYNTPAKPTAISGARIAASTVRVTLTNTASTSTGLEVQASTSPSDWSGAISQTFSGAGITTADVTGLSGVYYFRARNTRGALVSAWSPVSSAVATLMAPAAPTLKSPNVAVWNIATPTITYKWQHNPLDGSSQTAATLQTSTDGGSTWTSYTVSTAQQKAVTYSGADVGNTITWRVRTKGADASYGPYSATKSFLIAQVPTISIALEDGNGVPINGTLTDMPLVYVLTVNDPSGTVAVCDVSVGDYTESVDTGLLTGQIDASEFLPENNQTYTFGVSVQSTSTLSASASTTFDTSFTMPQAGTLAIADDDGTEILTVGLAPQQVGETAAVSISVYRDYGGKMALVAENLADGDTLSDYYAPYNVDFDYIVATFSAAGIATQTRFSHHIRTNKWAVVYGGGRVASAIWNPAGDIALKRPHRTLVQYIGRTYPVSYDGTALSDERTMSWVLLSEVERDMFMDLMESGGVGVYKSGDGAVFMAAFSIKFAPAYQTRTKYGTVTLSITRTESAAL